MATNSTIEFYTYNGRRDAVNKLSVAVRSGIIFDVDELRNSSIGANGGRVVLDHSAFEESAMPVNSVNYCVVSPLFGKQYHYWVTLEQFSDGMVIANLEVDAAETAWWAGCCNVSNFVNYSDDSSRSALFDDTRRGVQPITTRTSYEIGTRARLWGREYYVVVANIANQGARTGIVGAPAVWCYKLDSIDSFLSALNALSETDRKRYVPSILRLIAVPLIGGRSQNLNGSHQSKIQLASVEQSWYDYLDTSGGRTISIDAGGTLINHNSQTEVELTPANTWALDIDLTEDNRRSGTLTIYYPLCGTVTVPVSSINTDHINSVGFRASYDVVGGTIKVIPVINGVTFNEIPITTSIYEQGVILTNNNTGAFMQSVTALASGALTSALSFGSGNIAAGAMSLTATVGGLANSINSAAATASSISGNWGGNVDWHYNRPITVILNWHGFLTPAPSRRGVPYFSNALIRAQSGYIETSNASFQMSGLPSSIVRDAETAFDSGIYIFP